MRGRELGLREYLHDFVGDLPLLGRKRRRVSVPAQTGADVRVEPRVLARELVGESVQLTNLVEKRLERRIVDGHELRVPCRLDASLAAGRD